MNCPYCSQDIPADTIVCRHCGRNLLRASATPVFTRAELSLTSIGRQLQRIFQPDSGDGPSLGLSLLFAILLPGLVAGLALMIGRFWSGSRSGLELLLGVYLIAAAVGIMVLAVRGCDPEKRGFWRYAGMFLLTLVPLADCYVFFCAGRELARALPRK